MDTNKHESKKMSLTKYNPNELSTTDAPASWDAVQYWANVAARFQQASLAAQVMAGFALAELRKNFSRGGDRTPGANPHDAGLLTFEETCKQHAGISDDTARRWIAMADGIKARWKKLAPQARLKQLMSVPVNEWTEDDSKLIAESLHKVTDGQSQLDFMRELGLAKMPQGSGARGGIGSVGGQQKLTMSEEVALRRELAQRDWYAANTILRNYKDKFLLLADDEITAQIGTLEQALKARKKWLKQPVGRRDAKAIAALFEVSAWQS